MRLAQLLSKLRPAHCFLAGTAFMTLIPEKSYLKISMMYHSVFADDEFEEEFVEKKENQKEN